MKKGIFVISALFCCLFMVTNGVYSYSISHKVTGDELTRGFASEKIWLVNNALPSVTISGITYTATNVDLPKNVHPGNPAQPQVQLGMERKRAFAMVRVPVYSPGSDKGSFNGLSSFIIDITEQTPPSNNGSTNKTTDVQSSVLATGTWYKIAITKTGFYKLDFNFFNSLGINASTINPANIRIYGNGGNMLSEDNAVPRPSDLLENSIWVNDGGDNTFNAGDFVVFYAVGPTGWTKDSANQRFSHLKNLYTDTAYYFVTVTNGAGARIQEQANAPAANTVSNGFNYYDVHDADLTNPSGYGKTWYGETFVTDYGTNAQTFNFDLGSSVSSVNCKFSFGSTSPNSGSAFSVTLNGGALGTAVFDSPTTGDNIMTHSYQVWNGTCNSQTASLGITFLPIVSSSVGYLEYIEVNTRRALSVSGDQMNFRDWQTVGSGKVASYPLGGANSSTQVWDVTNPQVPVLMKGTLAGSTYTFSQDAAMLHEFAAMNSTNLLTPKNMGQVVNQNLHATGPVDLIIVTYPDFADAANMLATFHRSHDNMKVLVATTSQVYNEFSSGGQDISAIRDFARMFYKRAKDSTELPKYLLLFGGASYDYKYRLPNNSNFMPTYETANDSNDLYSYPSDDFFGYLDDNEYIESSHVINTLDIGVGRIPSRNTPDAVAVASKIISYKAPATLGPWRISSMFVADNNDGAGDHMNDAEYMAASVTQSSKDLYNEQKVYIDATPTVSTPAGPRCPNANAAIDDQIFQGTFLVNYNGHGNTGVWASERILTSDDYNLWNNSNMLPFMITATCDFGQFDHPQFVSAAEQLMIKGNGGVIAIVTTTQAVFANFNKTLNSDYLSEQFDNMGNNRWNSFGEALRLGKNQDYVNDSNFESLCNFRKFALLGDPALTPDFPQYNIRLDSINDGLSNAISDTIKALGKYKVSGSIRGYDSSVLTNFNGTLSVSFYDKPRKVATITANQIYSIQDNIIYKGKVTVTNGFFSFEFITPKDINYYFGTGKFSAYAENGITDAAGVDTSFSIGGFSTHPVTSISAPIVQPYINDSLFENGGITGNNTSLFVKLFSETGINVSGYTIGHDLEAILDGDIEQPYVLNNYYETAPNTYQAGYVTYPLLGLADGKHTLLVRAWDVNNNEGTGSVDFMVIDGKIVDIQNLGNYPNPFSNSTHFIFEHNHPGEQLDIQINIYSVDGKLVKNIKESFMPTSSRSTEITWDGTDNNGVLLPSGIYVYKLNLKTETGYNTTAYQKLIITR